MDSAIHSWTTDGADNPIEINDSKEVIDVDEVGAFTGDLTKQSIGH
jgi:hypothetical protein